MTIITGRRASAALALWLAAAGAAAQVLPDLPLPEGGVRTVAEVEAGARYRLPTGAWTAAQGLPTRRVDGQVSRAAWRIPGGTMTPGQVVAPIRDALDAAGWTILLDCASEGCGGFDFRFETEVLPAPDMYVNLTDYHFLSAEAPDGAAVLGVLVSRSAADGFVQVIGAIPGPAPESPFPVPVIDPDDAAPALPIPATQGLPSTAGSMTGSGPAVVATLEAEGHAILTDMQFESGDSSLGDAEVASLDAIADYLYANPDRRVLFVGHTDATGSLEANRALSRDRAGAAVAYLRDRHGLGADRISADGAGYLAPVASNLDADGRIRNRRVEAVLLPGE
ncbi:OmpA family protein [Roseivivax isoporae]|uniref:Cell envelope biogenesis protein OmpA n=1 Tax=Roseivivax isoporae LMG 25204 TaxID=1449351 RepID=X7FEJ1_9RHOB|nr:OmpA family protein [Roseivivax isoporae]ETX30439.1 cell envelope biogenesis protein OmpA [Roseivivax isoporae LMG 25204]